MIKINSSVKNYTVIFDTIVSSLEENYNDGDIIIVDRNLISEIDTINDYKFISIESSEHSKEFGNISIIIEQLLNFNITKENKIIAIGGGITQDVVSFISTILFRGVEWIFYPTSLLSQGDSCIGGKSSINFKNYKNQLGTFYPPSQVIIDTNLLASLNDSDYISGLGEMLHFYLVSSEKDFNYYKNTYKTNIKKLVKRCLEIKKEFIEIDEFDKKERLLLNYGHTFGHAIESVCNYEIPHGIAVCLGMDIANFVSYKLGYINIITYSKLSEFINSIHNVEYNINNMDDYIKALKKDKKNTSHTHLTCVLTYGPGQMFLTQVSYNKIKDILVEYYDYNSYINKKEK